jgi:hypothetical protein
METRDICGFPSQVGEEVVVLDAKEVETIERGLDAWRRIAVPFKANFAWEKWRVPSALVRVDMAPLRSCSENGHVPIYEIEGGPGGLGFMQALCGDKPFQIIADAFCAIGVEEIGWDVAPDRVRFESELAAGIGALERCEIRAVRGMYGNERPLLIRSGGSDIPFGRCICDYSSGGGDKHSLSPFGAKSTPNVREPFAEYPDGFVLKPRCGTGAKSVEVWARRAPHKEFGVTKSRMARMYECFSDSRDILGEAEWVVQPFFPPEHLPDFGGRLRIWRVFAVWNGERYVVVGGVWNARRSLRIHGATDTVHGGIQVG